MAPTLRRLLVADAVLEMPPSHRKLGRVLMDWILTGEVADDGRVRRIHQLARSA